jgi:hypothetical protein
MGDKVTKVVVKYPEGLEPTFTVPTEYGPDRYLLGRAGKKPLVVIGMNPSAARDNTSDRTVSKIIRISQTLGYDGWTVMNTYPERATDAKDMDVVDQHKISRNIAEVEDYIVSNNISEIWGAWGDLKYDALIAGRDALLAMLKQHHVNVFYFGTLTKAGNPRHPLYMSQAVIGNDKKQPYFKDNL